VLEVERRGLFLDLKIKMAAIFRPKSHSANKKPLGSFSTIEDQKKIIAVLLGHQEKEGKKKRKRKRREME